MDHKSCNLSSRWTFPTILLAVCQLTASVYAAPGTEGASFLDIPVGAGPAALGGSYSARATDPYAIVWNPAGLARVGNWEAVGQHLSYLETLHYEFAGLSIPLRPGSTLGAGAQYLGTGNVTQTDNFGAEQGSFSSRYGAYSLAYGQAIGDRLSVGATGKLIEAKLSDVEAKAFAADVGGLYHWRDQVTVAATLTNMGSPLTFVDQGDPLPLTLRAGFLYKGTMPWSISLDGAYRRSGLASAHTGIEWHPLAAVALRAGYRTDHLRELSPLAGFSTGFGFQWMGQELAYAWVPVGELGDTHYLSFRLRFGALHEDSKNLVYAPHRQYFARGWEPPATVRHSASRQREIDSMSAADYEALIQLLSDEPTEMAARMLPEATR